MIYVHSAFPWQVRSIFFAFVVIHRHQLSYGPSFLYDPVKGQVEPSFFPASDQTMLAISAAAGTRDVNFRNE